MCGFFSYLKKKDYIDLTAFNNASNLLKNRGPDGNRFYKSKNLLTKFYRLSIQDTSSKGMQPMVMKNRYVLVFNGEIYNFKELAIKFNFKLKSKSDSEVLLNLLILKGRGALKYLDGMFSFFFYDEYTRKGFIARDRFGIKPLYYYDHRDFILISSEIKPILNYINDAKLDDKAIINYFFFGSLDHSQKTFFKKILSLEPGCYADIQNHKIISKRYWSIENTKIKSEKKFENRLEKVKSLIDNSIKKHLISDREIVLSMSTGTDSTSLAFLMNKNTKSKLNTYTYSFAQKKNEIDSMGKISEHIEMNNQEIRVNHEDVIKNFNKLTSRLESPFTSLRLMGQFLLYKKVASDGHKVVITGDGGDEMLGGYDYNVPHHIRDKFPNILSSKFINELEKFSYTKSQNELKRKKKMLNLLISLNFQHGTTSDGTPFLNTDNFNKDYLDQNLNENLFFFKKIEKLNHLKNSQYYDIKNIKLPRVLKYTDRMSMAYGVETRVPFLDHKLFEYVFNLENKDKISDNYETRFIFKKSLKEMTNSNIKFNKTKNTITDPQGQWLRNEMKSFTLDIFNSIEFRKLDYFNYKNCISNFENFCKNKNQSSFHFFQILSFAIFQKLFIKNNKHSNLN